MRPRILVVACGYLQLPFLCRSHALFKDERPSKRIVYCDGDGGGLGGSGGSSEHAEKIVDI